MHNIESIYAEYKDMVFNLALHYTQNKEDAEEIAQDTFLSVHKNMGQFRSESSVKTWIYKITINRSLDFIKAKSRKKRWAIFNSQPLETEDRHISGVNFNHPGVELEQKEALARIFAAINKLPKNQKTVLILLKIEGLSQQEVADIQDSSTKAVESLFQRAKANLKKQLDQTKEN